MCIYTYIPYTYSLLHLDTPPPPPRAPKTELNPVVYLFALHTPRLHIPTPPHAYASIPLRLPPRPKNDVAHSPFHHTSAISTPLPSQRMRAQAEFFRQISPVGRDREAVPLTQVLGFRV